MNGGWAVGAASFTTHNYIVKISVGVVVVTDNHVADDHPPPPLLLFLGISCQRIQWQYAPYSDINDPLYVTLLERFLRQSSIVSQPKHITVLPSIRILTTSSFAGEGYHHPKCWL